MDKYGCFKYVDFSKYGNNIGIDFPRQWQNWIKERSFYISLHLPSNNQLFYFYLQRKVSQNIQGVL